MTAIHRSKLVLTLLAIGGCSQIIGLSDYEVDPSLDEPGSGGESAGSGGKTNAGGKTSVIPGLGGEGGAVGGTSGEGGVLNEGGVSGDGAGGDAQGGEPSVGGASGSGGSSGSGGKGGSGGTGTVLVPCDSAACCTLAAGVATGVELLEDGGFELGTVAEGNTPWTESSTNDIPAITDDTSFGWSPREGLYYAYLAGLQDETSTIWSEDVTIPNDAGWIEVTGYRLFQVDATDATNSDYSVVGFYGYEANSPDEEPFYWTDPAVTGSNGWGNVSVWTRFTASWSATPHKGKVRYLGIEGYADTYPVVTDPDDTDASSYLYDSISLKVFRCYK